MLKGMMLVNTKLSELEIVSSIDEAIDWWKYKNIWKRPITEDDTKAVRMIKQRLNIK